ncbi:MAG: ComEC family competence protein [Afipia sp.]|nr:ComEC family competence protein [Afipia sp.]
MSDQGERERRPSRTPARATTWPPRKAGDAALDAGSFLPSISETIHSWVRAEAGPGRSLPWVPVAFGVGIALYFAADHEPILAIVAPFALILCLAAFLSRRRRFFPVVVMIAATASGFAIATLKSARVAHVVLTKPVYSASIKGFVETHEERERTDRFVLRVEEMDVPRGQTKIDRVRLSVRKGAAPEVGSFVELKARLQPPLPPQRPGSYDFSRDMYFAGIGASGFAMGAIKTVEAPKSGGMYLRYAALMQSMRDAIDARIRSVLSGDNRAIATALLTGRRDAITMPVNDAMFISGLGHVLSISGYHMAVVAGVVFFGVRALLALFPILTVTFAIKKWSALAALIAATFYLLLSGAEVATQRSYFMTAVVLIAVMVDRRAITFRTLAVAAMIVLVFAPESLVHPSFQMSFAATLGLVAIVQISMPNLFASPENSKVARAALWGGREIAALAMASLIAGLATTPYAAFHFHRITPYGVLANLAAMPVVSAVVMPAGLLGLIAIPFGLDGLFWRLMDAGIVWMVAVSQWVAALPGAIGRMASFSSGALAAMSIGIVMLGLLRTPLRWAGAGVIVLATLWAVAAPKPDILVAGDGYAVGVRGRDGLLRVMRTGKDAFMMREWLAADADPRTASDAALSDGVSCDEAGCVTARADGRLVALSLKQEALADDCTQAAVVVTLRQPPSDCQAFVIGPDTLKQQGTLSLRKTTSGFEINAIKPRGVDRPWAPAIVDAEPQSGAPKRAQPVDATPTESDLQAED